LTNGNGLTNGEGIDNNYWNYQRSAIELQGATNWSTLLVVGFNYRRKNC
jgi:hypothetical protein